MKKILILICGMFVLFTNGAAAQDIDCTGWGDGSATQMKINRCSFKELEETLEMLDEAYQDLLTEGVLIDERMREHGTGEFPDDYESEVSILRKSQGLWEELLYRVCNAERQGWDWSGTMTAYLSNNCMRTLALQRLETIKGFSRGY